MTGEAIRISRSAADASALRGSASCLPQARRGAGPTSVQCRSWTRRACGRGDLVLALSIGSLSAAAMPLECSKPPEAPPSLTKRRAVRSPELSFTGGGLIGEERRTRETSRRSSAESGSRPFCRSCFAGVGPRSAADTKIRLRRCSLPRRYGSPDALLGVFEPAARTDCRRCSTAPSSIRSRSAPRAPSAPSGSSCSFIERKLGRGTVIEDPF